eukprot:SM000020S05989  [mRNA]  locus=s20:220856:223495:- [translate_table: standard]
MCCFVLTELGQLSSGLEVWAACCGRCEKEGCSRSAEGRTQHCIAHGGGRRCHADGCIKAARGSTGRCIKHGGGKRCTADACKRSAEGQTGLCISHGGGRRCQFPLCPKGAQGCDKGAEGRTHLCKAHGGGKRCTFSGGKLCTKSVHGGTNFCIAHGGGKRCKEERCGKSARGKTDYCVRHGGGRRCCLEDCGKSAQGSTDYCKSHGGGRRCSWITDVETSTPCAKFARSKAGLCSTHSAALEEKKVHGGQGLGLGIGPGLFGNLASARSAPTLPVKRGRAQANLQGQAVCALQERASAGADGAPRSGAASAGFRVRHQEANSETLKPRLGPDLKPRLGPDLGSPGLTCVREGSDGSHNVDMSWQQQLNFSRAQPAQLATSSSLRWDCAPTTSSGGGLASPAELDSERRREAADQVGRWTRIIPGTPHTVATDGLEGGASALALGLGLLPSTAPQGAARPVCAELLLPCAMPLLPAGLLVPSSMREQQDAGKESGVGRRPPIFTQTWPQALDINQPPAEGHGLLNYLGGLVQASVVDASPSASRARWRGHVTGLAAGPSSNSAGAPPPSGFHQFMGDLDTL